MDDVVTYERDGPVAWLTIRRPEARNALDAAVREGLRTGFARFEADADAAALVLTGEGDVAFCAGLDLRELVATGLTVPPPGFIPQPGRTEQVVKPVIAAVNGVAYAGGFVLAMCADLVVAADHARFAITEGRVGRGAPWAASLPWLVPPRVAMELLVTGEPISADRAYEVGLVNRVVPLADLRAAAQALGESIAATAPLMVRASKAMVYASAEHARTAAFETAEALFTPVYESEDAQEGPRAFLERRPPVWRGR